MNKYLCKKCQWENKGKKAFPLEFTDEEDKQWELRFEDMWARGCTNCPCNGGSIYILNNKSPKGCKYMMEQMMSNDQPTEPEIERYLKNPYYLRRLENFKGY